MKDQAGGVKQYFFLIQTLPELTQVSFHPCGFSSLSLPDMMILFRNQLDQLVELLFI